MSSMRLLAAKLSRAPLPLCEAGRREAMESSRSLWVESGEPVNTQELRVLVIVATMATMPRWPQGHCGYGGLRGIHGFNAPGAVIASMPRVL